MKRNTKLTPEQKIVQAAIKWYCASKNKFNAIAEQAFVKVIVRYNKTVDERVRLGRYVADERNYNALSIDEQSVLDCTRTWWDICTGERSGSTDDYLASLKDLVKDLIEHQKKEKRDAIVGTHNCDLGSDDPSVIARWFGRMARKGAQYVACHYDEGDAVYYLASRLPVTARDAEREWNRECGWEDDNC